MRTVIKFYFASGPDAQALLDAAEDLLTARFDRGMPPGSSHPQVVPQLTRGADGSYDLLITVTFTISTTLDPTFLDFRLRDA